MLLVYPCISLYRHHAMFILTILPTSCTICITNINRQSFHLIPRNIFSQKYIKWGINSNVPFRREHKSLQPRDFMEFITIAGRSSVQNISSSNGKLLSVGCMLQAILGVLKALIFDPIFDFIFLKNEIKNGARNEMKNDRKTSIFQKWTSCLF